MDGPALQDAQDTQHDGQSHRNRHDYAQLQGVGTASLVAIGDCAGLRRNGSRFRSDGNQRRLGDGRAETKTECEGQQRGQAALVGKSSRQRFSQGKQSAFQSLDEKRQPGAHAEQPDDHVPQVGEGLL